MDKGGPARSAGSVTRWPSSARRKKSGETAWNSPFSKTPTATTISAPGTMASDFRDLTHEESHASKMAREMSEMRIASPFADTIASATSESVVDAPSAERKKSKSPS